MTIPSCLDLALICPDLPCPKCNKPYQTWVWKKELLFTCPDCNELGFSVENKAVNDDMLPENSFYSELEWPCEDDPDPGCFKLKKMLFIENYESLEFLNGKFSGSNSAESYSKMQEKIGLAYETILSRILS